MTLVISTASPTHAMRVIRTALGLTQTQLATRAGVSLALVAAIEKAYYPPSKRTRAKLSRVLGADPWETEGAR
jgi:transcriptional regulator with XRE-family HTH domain